jgi:serine/arginine repetitive matrix protein 2
MGEVDMEVDMEGGKECGVADKAVKRSGSANPSSSALPTNVSIVDPPVHSGGQWSMPGVGTEHSQDKCEQVESRNIDLPPGFAPMLHEEDPGLSRPPGFESKVEALRQVLLPLLRLC